MPSETTKLNNIIDPEVMAPMIGAKIEKLCKLTPYAKVDTSLMGVPGDTITIPCWNYVGDAVDVNEGDEVETKKLTASTTQFTIKNAMQSISFTEKARIAGAGNIEAQAEKQLSQAIAGKVDSDLVAAAYTSNNIYDGSSAVIGYAGVVEAVCGFEDEEEDVEKVMFIHPEQEATLLKDDDFTSADKFEAGVAVNGSIGKIAGCWVKKSKKVVKSDAVTKVNGTWTLTLGGTVATDDTIKVDGVTITVGATQTAAGAASNVAAGTFPNFTATASSAVVTLTEKDAVAGKTTKPVVELSNAATTCAVAQGTKGVTPFCACWNNPIIKLEPDDPESEYTEDELPALKIFLKKNVQVDHEWFPKKQQHDVTASEYYGCALTNASKVIVAKFGVTNAS